MFSVRCGVLSNLSLSFNCTCGKAPQRTVNNAGYKHTLTKPLGVTLALRLKTMFYTLLYKVGPCFQAIISRSISKQNTVITLLNIRITYQK